VARTVRSFEGSTASDEAEEKSGAMEPFMTPGQPVRNDTTRTAPETPCENRTLFTASPSRSFDGRRTSTTVEPGPGRALAQVHSTRSIDAGKRAGKGSFDS
jgi:hypothetical protein